MATRELTARELTAHHESAHAVLGYVLEKGVDEASIEGDHDGRVTHRSNGLDQWKLLARNAVGNHLIQKDFTNYLVVTLAGAVEETLLVGQPSERAIDDLRIVAELVLIAFPDPNEREQYVQKLRSETAGLLSEGCVERAISAVAQALLERGRLSAAEIRQIIREQLEISLNWDPEDELAQLILEREEERAA
jgi:hypothetical protein